MNMGRASKLKKENMKKANELLEQGHQQKYPSKQNVPLRPTDNVRKNPQSFVSKMNNLQTEEIEEGTRCWKGYEKKGMKTMFGKRVPNCVKKEEIIREEPEKDTYWVITKANRENLIKLGGVAEEIGRSATNNFQKYCK
tara:strand:- start:1260 stop:1676 length:417 start_codon:yes stop_codon:yes gene_type:complete